MSLSKVKSFSDTEISKGKRKKRNQLRIDCVKQKLSIIMKCGACNENIENEEVYCQGCQSNYHYGNCSVAQKTWVHKGEPDKSSWRCKSCRDSRSAKVINTKETVPFSFTLPQYSKQNPQESESSKIEEKLSQILSTMEKNTTELANLKATIETNQSSLMKELQSRDDNFQKLEERVGKLEEFVNENSSLPVESSLKIMEKLNDLDQYYRNKNFEIHNVTEVKGEKLVEVVIKIGNKLNIGIKEENIEAVHRIPLRNTNNPRPIIVQLNSRKLCDSIIRSKKKKELVLQDVMQTNDNRPIYVNENLSPFFRELLYKARLLKKKLGFKFCRYINRKILLCKEENARNYWIKNEMDLNKLEERISGHGELDNMDTEEIEGDEVRPTQGN